MCRWQPLVVLSLLAVCVSPALAGTPTLQSALWSMTRRALPLILAILGLFAMIDIGAIIFRVVLRGMSNSRLR